MTFHNETWPGVQAAVWRHFCAKVCVALAAVVTLMPDCGLASSAAITFSGQVPARNAQIRDMEIVGFSESVLLPVPAIGANWQANELRVQTMDVSRSFVIWSAAGGGALPEFVAVPVKRGDETRYRVCVYLQQSLKMRCRAYRIIPAPGMN